MRTCCVVPVAAFQDWMQRYDSVRRFVYEAFVQRLAAVMLLVDEVLFGTSTSGWRRCFFSAPPRKRPVLSTTHERLALELGTAREVVSRILKSFEEDGAVRLFRGAHPSHGPKSAGSQARRRVTPVTDDLRRCRL